MSDILQVAVAHIVDAKDKAVLVLGNGIADVLEKLIFLLASLLGDLGHVHHLRALRFRHGGGDVFIKSCEKW